MKERESGGGDKERRGGRGTTNKNKREVESEMERHR
jgi:hypothetical protein